ECREKRHVDYRLSRKSRKARHPRNQIYQPVRQKIVEGRKLTRIRIGNEGRTMEAAIKRQGNRLNMPNGIHLSVPHVHNLSTGKDQSDKTNRNQGGIVVKATNLHALPCAGT